MSVPRVFRRWWFWAGSGLIAGVLVLIMAFLAAVPLSSDTLRHRMIATLSDRLDSDVELGDLHVRAFPALHAEGANLVIRRRGRADTPPLIVIKSFSADAGLMGLWRNHVARVTLTGLDISIPPDHGDLDNGADDSDAGGLRAVVIDSLDTKDARLIILPDRKDKQPKIWAIHSLTMHDVGARTAMPFDATLTNAIPPGEITTSGSFGPWQKRDPGATPLDGRFDFAHADLSVFKGIAGDLSSKGSFRGTLDRIVAEGETETPNFTIVDSHHPFALHTTYHSIIDGTNGDTRLQSIDARFLSSHLLASGAVLDGPPGTHGRTVTLAVKMDRAHVEDVLTMAMKGKPLMSGALQLATTFLLPPGETDVIERLRLDGRFRIAKAKFSEIDVQSKIDELSHRARARDADEKPDNVVSNFGGRFKLGSGRLQLPDLTFDAPGAKVQLAGQFGIKPETLDFKGMLLMDARVSQTVGGVKGFFLKIVDPLFGKDGGGSAIPIKIGGSVKEPSFGLDVRRVFSRGKKP